MTDYNINTDIAYGPLKLIDIDRIIDECDHPWFNQTLCSVNDCVVRIGILKGEFHWHKHDEEDEFFYVLEGQWLVDLEDETIELNPGQGLMVPKGVMHKTRAPVRTVENWMSGVSAPSLGWFVKILDVYGPGVLAEVMPGPCEWLSAAVRVERRAQLEAEQRRIEREMAALDEVHS